MHCSLRWVPSQLRRLPAPGDPVGEKFNQQLSPWRLSVAPMMDRYEK
jgi:hypothetical protein